MYTFPEMFQAGELGSHKLCGMTKLGKKREENECSKIFIIALFIINPKLQNTSNSNLSGTIQ